MVLEINRKLNKVKIKVIEKIKRSKTNKKRIKVELLERKFYIRSNVKIRRRKENKKIVSKK